MGLKQYKIFYSADIISHPGREILWEKLSLVSRSSKDISENFKKNFFTETLSMLDVHGMQLTPNMQPF